MKKEIMEMARAAGLSVCVNAESTFNRQVKNFAIAVQAPLLLKIEALEGSVRKGYRADCERGHNHPESVVARQGRIAAAQTAAEQRAKTISQAIAMIEQVTLKPDEVADILRAVAESINPQTGDDTHYKLIELADETESGV